MISSTNPENNTTSFSGWKIALPLITGLGVVVWMFLKEFDPDSLKTVHISLMGVLFLVVAIVLMLLRDMGMIWRFRLLTGKQLSWKQAFNVHMLSEFTSSVTPSALGGSALVVLFMNKEGVSVGRSTAVMFAGLLLDELYFIVACPLMLVFMPVNELFNASTVVTSTISLVVKTIYLLIVLWTIILYIGLFHRPDLISRLFGALFSLPVLRRWKQSVDDFGHNIVESSRELRSKSPLFWFKASLTTFLTWTSRFLVVNALFLIFTQDIDQVVIFGRQLVLWLVMIISPTPGGSGISEYAFKQYYNDIALGSGPVLLIIVLWRLLSYYLYLAVGTMIIPGWLQLRFRKSAH